jgi:hypothetical protein
MRTLIEEWQASADPRAAFLSCYQLMTQGMLEAINNNEFNDQEWVYSFLHHFAEYYFTALEQYEHDSSLAPSVWQRAFDAARQPDTLVLQNLLLGINAHINYDLIFTLADVLEPDWSRLTPDERQGRYDDYTHVNKIIGSTIDTVQDTIIEPDFPVMDVFDRLLGSTDEWAVSHIINQWREEVWLQALQLLDALENERQDLKRQYEQQALRRASHILLV